MAFLTEHSAPVVPYFVLHRRVTWCLFFFTLSWHCCVKLFHHPLYLCHSRDLLFCITAGESLSLIPYFLYAMVYYYMWLLFSCFCWITFSPHFLQNHVVLFSFLKFNFSKSHFLYSHRIQSSGLLQRRFWLDIQKRSQLLRTAEEWDSVGVKSSSLKVFQIRIDRHLVWMT